MKLKTIHEYSIWYGLTGQMLECIVDRNSTLTHSVLVRDIDRPSSSHYVTRDAFANILRATRGQRSISVVRYH